MDLVSCTAERGPDQAIDENDPDTDKSSEIIIGADGWVL